MTDTRWRWTTVYAAAQQYRILASLRTCISTWVWLNDFSLVGIDLGVFARFILTSSFHLSHFCVASGGTISPEESFRPQISRYSNFPIKRVGKIKPKRSYREASSLNIYFFGCFLFFYGGYDYRCFVWALITA